MGIYPSAAMPIPCPVCFGIGVTSPRNREPLSTSLLAAVLQSLSPHPAALDFGKWKGKGKKQGSGTSADRGMERGTELEVRPHIRLSTIKSETIQDIDKSFHVDVLSSSFQLMSNHFSSGRNRKEL